MEGIILILRHYNNCSSHEGMYLAEVVVSSWFAKGYLFLLTALKVTCIEAMVVCRSGSMNDGITILDCYDCAYVDCQLVWDEEW